MSESYDETNKRMSQALGPRSGIQTSTDVAEAEAVQQAKRELESQANPALAGSHVDGWDGITFRCEPPDRFQFIYDKASNAVIIRDMQQETAAEEAVTSETGSRTFFATASGADVTVSTGAINNEIAAEYTATPADGDKFYIDVEVDAFDEVIAVDIAHGASVPANTTTHGYTLLASVAVAGGVATVTPFAWNYSQVQKCGDTNYLWGGFGS
jgi:hypothetical protein